MTARVAGKTLVLDDLSRLFRETGGWDGQCAVEVDKYADGSRYIAVIETDDERLPVDATERAQ